MKADLFAASKLLASLFIVAAPVAFPGGAVAQETNQGKWADENDPIAKALIEQERKWATMSCTPGNAIVAASAAFIPDFLAADFVGTSPKGPLYTRAEMMPKEAPAKDAESARDCKLISAKVRFFGPEIAVIYGRESAVRKGADGKEATQTLVWTDTLLRRGGKWQAVAVQDMVVPSE
jgi:hypothetical protein